MSGGDEQQGRQVRTMQDLLRFCIQGTASEDAPRGGVSVIDPLDPERRAWLEDAIKTLSVDVVKEMLETIANIKRKLEDLSRGDQSCVESISASVDFLVERIQDLDIAADFEKIQGFNIINPLLQNSHPELRIKGAELLGELVQNHEPCQSAALREGMLDILINILANDKDEAVRGKSLFAISCLIRGYNEGLDTFVNNFDGFSVLLAAMQSSSLKEEGLKIRTKTAFLLTSMINNRPDFKETLFKMGFIHQIVGLLHQEHDQSHEHLLSTLLNFITDFPQALEECFGRELKLKSLLQQRLKIVGNKPEYLEEEGYCKSILDLLNSNGGGNDNEPESYSTDR